MRCRLCHTPCTPEEVFCPHCGSPVNLPGALIEDPPPPLKALPAPKKRPHFRRIFAVCAAVCLALALIGTLSYALTRPPRFGETRCTFAYADGRLYSLSQDGQAVRLTDSRPSVVRYSPNGTGLLWQTESNGMGLCYEGNSISVTNSVDQSLLSFDGTAAAYVTTAAALYWVDMTTGEERLVAEDLAQPSYLALSPDGDFLVYNDREDQVWLSCRGGTPELLEKGMLPVFVSQNGETVYLMDHSDTSLYSLRDGVLTFLTDSFRNFYTNRTGTELFYGSEEGLFFSRDGGPFRMLSPEPCDSATPILPTGCGAAANYFSVYDVSTLVGLPVSCLTLEGDGLYDIQGYTTAFVRLEEDGAVPLAQCSGNAFCRLSADGETFFYTDGPTLYSCAMTGKAAPVEVLSVPEMEAGQRLYVFFDDRDTPRFLWTGGVLSLYDGDSITPLADTETSQGPFQDPAGRGMYALRSGEGEGYTLTRYDWSGNAVDCCPEVAVTYPVSVLGDGLFFTDENGKDWYLDETDTLTDLSRLSAWDGSEQEGL